MKLEGIHHITAITGDAPGNVGFYTGTMGLRMVKKTVNQDDPTVYHLFYADEAGSPGADLTFFEYPGARSGTPGAGMVHRIVWRVASEEALSFCGQAHEVGTILRLHTAMTRGGQQDAGRLCAGIIEIGVGPAFGAEQPVEIVGDEVFTANGRG